MKEGEEKKRKGKKRKGKERDGGSGCRYQLEIRALFFFLFFFFLFFLFGLLRGGDYYFLFPVQLIAATTFLVCKV